VSNLKADEVREEAAMLRYIVRFSLLLTVGLSVVMSLIAGAPSHDLPTVPQKRDGAFREVLRYGRGVPQSVYWQPNGEIILVNTVTGVWLYTDTLSDLHHFPALRDARFSPDGRWIIGKEDENSAIYDAGSFELSKRFEADYWFTFSPDGRYLWYLDEGEGVVVLRTEDLTATSPVPFSGQAKSIHWSANGERLAVVYADRIEVWEAEQLKYMLPRSRESFPNWSPDGTRLLIDHPDNTLELLDGGTGELIAEIPADERFPSEPVGDPEYAVTYYDGIVWKPDGREFVRYYLEYQFNAGFEVFSSEGGEKLFEYISGELSNVEFSPDGHYLVTSFGIFETNTYNTVYDLQNFRGIVSPDSQHAVLVPTYAYPIPQLYTLASAATTVMDVAGDGTGYSGQVWSADSKRLLTWSNGYLELWDVATGTVIYPNADHVDYKDYLFSETGERVAFADNSGTVRIWNTRTGTMVSTLRGSGFPLTSWAWQPGGHLLAVSNGTPVGDRPPDGNMVYMWDTDQGRLAGRVQHEGVVTELEWSPDGELLVIGGYGSTLQIADPYRTLAIKSLGSMEFPQFHWSPDGHLLWVVYRAGSHGGAGIKLWNRETNTRASGNFGFVGLAAYQWNTSQNALLFAHGGCEWHVPPYLCSARIVIALNKPVDDLAYDFNNSDAYGTTPTLKITGLPHDPELFWSHNGARLMVKSGDLLQVWDIEAREMILMTFGVKSASWSVNRPSILIEYEGRRAEIRDMETNTVLSQFRDVDYAAWLEDGETVMIRRGEGHYDYQYFNGERRLDFPKLPVNMSADGNTLIHLQNGVVTLWSRE
jgi:WD40 repeat protein